MADRIDQIEKMRAGVAYRFKVRLRAFEIELRPLTAAENLSVTNETIQELETKPASLRTSLMEANILAMKMLELASTSGPGERDHKITGYVLQNMTPDEVQYLYKQWVDEVEKVSPAIESISEEELVALSEEVKKNDAALTTLSRSRLLALVRFYSING